MFSLRCSLFAIDNLLLGVTSLLFTAHLLFGSCFSLVGSSLSSLTPCRLSLAGSMLTTCNWLFPLAAHGLPFAVLGVRHSSVANRRALVDCSQRFACQVVTSSNSLIVVINCRLLSNNITLLASRYSQLVTGPYAPNTLFFDDRNSLLFWYYLLSTDRFLWLYSYSLLFSNCCLVFVPRKVLANHFFLLPIRCSLLVIRCSLMLLATGRSLACISRCPMIVARCQQIVFQYSLPTTSVSLLATCFLSLTAQ